MKISTLNRIISEMREVYPFKDENTHIEITKMACSNYKKNKVTLFANAEDGTVITLSRMVGAEE